jgi:putative oxidoreductase
MKALSLPGTGRHASLAPLILRVVTGLVMFAHGYQKLTRPGGAESFGRDALAGLGVPEPVLMGYVVTFTELIGGGLLIVGLLSRLAALALTVDLTLAIVLVKLDVGLIAPKGGGAGAELDLALIAGFLAIVLLGPGSLSLDRALRIEDKPGERMAPKPSEAAGGEPSPGGPGQDS